MQRIVILVVIVAMVLAVAVPALAQVADDEHPCKTLVRHGRVHPIIEDTDVSSFRKSVAHYLSGVRRRYRVALGQYLLWNFVTKFPGRARVGRLWLHGDRQVCIAQKRDIGRIGVLCSIYVDIRIQKGRRVYRGAFARRATQVGAWCDPRRQDYRAIVRAEIRKPLDVATEAIAGRFVAAGVLPQE